MSEDEGIAAEELAQEFLAKKGLPANTKVHVEAQDEESDRFWDYFVNG